MTTTTFPFYFIALYSFPTINYPYIVHCGEGMESAMVVGPRRNEAVGFEFDDFPFFFLSLTQYKCAHLSIRRDRTSNVSLACSIEIYATYRLQDVRAIPRSYGFPPLSLFFSSLSSDFKL